MKFAPHPVMPVEVFVGMTGLIVVHQEFTTPTGETYLNILVSKDRARVLAEEILRLVEVP